MGTLANIQSRVSGLWRGRATVTSIAPADPAGDLPLNHDAKPVEKPVADTLKPAEVLKGGNALPALKQEAVFNALAYTPGTIRGLFANVAGMFVDLFTSYRELAEKRLSEAREALNAVETPHTIDATEATETLKGNLKPLAAKRLDAIAALKTTVKEAKAEFRRLTVGITGNPAILPQAKEVGLVGLLPIAAAIMVSMYFEVIFNAPILQNQGNLDMAIAFSVLVSLAGSITTFFAGLAKRTQLNHKNAEIEKQSCFSGGVDPTTGKPAEVFPMSGDAVFTLRLWHWLMALVITGTLVIRYVMMTELGDIAGSFGVVLVFAVLYGYEAIKGKVTHPRTAECLARKAEAETAEADLKALEGNVVSPEAREVFDSYTRSLSTLEATERTKMEARKKAADKLRRLSDEFSTSPVWFTEQFRETLQEVVASVGDRRTESNDELQTATIEVAPKFNTYFTTLDLVSGVEAASKTTTVVVNGRRMTAAELDKALVALTDELTKERATAKTAEEAAKPVVKPATTPREGWKAPRLI